MINETNQTDVAYEDEPKEQRRKPRGKNYQFPGKVMPQDEDSKEPHMKHKKHGKREKMNHRHKEHR